MEYRFDWEIDLFVYVWGPWVDFRGLSVPCMADIGEIAHFLCFFGAFVLSGEFSSIFEGFFGLFGVF